MYLALNKFFAATLYNASCPVSSHNSGFCTGKLENNNRREKCTYRHFVVYCKHRFICLSADPFDMARLLYYFCSISVSHFQPSSRVRERLPRGLAREPAAAWRTCTKRSPGGKRRRSLSRRPTGASEGERLLLRNKHCAVSTVL